ncbi:MAG: NADH:ubiquinone reductase (Na(+)-transporting) subunit A, partial [Bacteroidales bacterium]|nr:NADH:ubiquinone reductase (Na(+)-transporting) subunit A [Bacteroidales bacterium]
MSKTIVLKKGLDLPITGCAEKRLSKTLLSDVVAIQPADFKGLLPRLLVKEGDTVLAGSPVFSDKNNPDILITSPASGTVKAVVRGEKRKLLAVLIQTDPEQKFADFEVKSAAQLEAEDVKKALLGSGLWPWLIQRPYGILANPAVTPKAIFVSAFNTTPGAADTDFAFEGEIAAIQAGIDA